jgi:hypothetical protein
VEEVIGSSVLICLDSCLIPSVGIVVRWTTNRYVGNDILDFFVQSSVELDDDHKSLAVSSLFDQFSEFVDILIYQTLSFVIFLCP